MASLLPFLSLRFLCAVWLLASAVPLTVNTVSSPLLLWFHFPAHSLALVQKNNHTLPTFETRFKTPSGLKARFSEAAWEIPRGRPRSWAESQFRAAPRPEGHT